MTTVPPPSTPSPHMPAALPTAPVVLILQPPPAVAALPPGTVLEAVVIPTPPPAPAQIPVATPTPPPPVVLLPGTPPPPIPAPPPSTPAAPAPTAPPVVTLSTPVGDVIVRLPVALPERAQVEIEVVRSSPTQVTVRVVTIDGQPAAQVLAQLSRQAVETRALAPQTPQVSAQNPEVAAQNPAVRAAILPIGAAWTPSGPAQLPALGLFSAQVTLGITPAETPTPPLLPPQTPGGTLQNPVPTPQTPAGTPALPPGSPPPAAPPPLILVTGSELSVRITNVQLPSAPGTPAPAVAAPPLGVPSTAITPTPTPPSAVTPPLPTAPQPGLVLPTPQGLPPAPPQPPTLVQAPPVQATLSGTVIATTTTGAPVIETDAGQMQLNVRANVPVGTRVTIEITAQMLPRMTPMPPPIPASALPLSGPAGASVGWPTLSESLLVLQRSDPQAAQQLAQAIPDGGPRTAAAIMSFVQAMRAGDPRQWPGDVTLRALERAGPRGAHLASQLSEEVGAMSSRARDVGGEWRGLQVPWNADGQIDRIALILRREGEGDDDSKKSGGGKGTRFLIDLHLSRLGAMQLDGMFREETKGFDMMIRTKEALPDQIRLDLTGMFAASNAAMGLKGGLTFQVVKKFADPLGQNNPAGFDKSGLWA